MLLMVIEIKTEVATIIDRLPSIKPLQLFIEGYYAMQESILACVTDPAQFHVLKRTVITSTSFEWGRSYLSYVVTTSYTYTLHMLAECLLSEFSEL